MVFTGFSEVPGSCGMSPILSPRTSRHCCCVMRFRSWPLSSIFPDAAALAGSSPIVAMAEVDFPEPDSPTMAVTRPGATEKDTSVTACTGPWVELYVTARSVTFSNGVVMSGLLPGRGGRC